MAILIAVMGVGAVMLMYGVILLFVSIPESSDWEFHWEDFREWVHRPKFWRALGYLSCSLVVLAISFLLVPLFA